jgi:uncharacterized damage-inducible protein DinB
VKKASLLLLAVCFLLAAANARAAQPGAAKSARAAQSQSAYSSQPAPAQAQAQPKDTTPPSYDMKPQSLLDLETLNKKYVSLAEALPQEKFNWHPSDDTRTFAQLFLHVSGERYGILGLLGVPKPDYIDFKTYEKSTTDKAQIIAELNKSWEFAKNTISGMTNADFNVAVPKLGPDANKGDVVYILVADAHEHMGQAIAYARANGIVPPWTVAAAKAASAAKEKEKDRKQ